MPTTFAIWCQVRGSTDPGAGRLIDCAAVSVEFAEQTTSSNLATKDGRTIPEDAKLWRDGTTKQGNSGRTRAISRGPARSARTSPNYIKQSGRDPRKVIAYVQLLGYIWLHWNATHFISLHARMRLSWMVRLLYCWHFYIDIRHTSYVNLVSVFLAAKTSRCH